MSKDIKFDVKLFIEGKEQIVEASTSSQELAKELGIARMKGDELRTALLNFNQLTQTFQNVFSNIKQITDILGEYSSASAVQVEAETKLATAMRNTMGATDSEIQSIKDLCSVQQQLGVIGDEVQLSGAQELATYLEKKSSLEKLIPVMNDMIAQQYGLNATSESAASIATMLGKVMNGQVNALSRYGYSFDEVQKQILQFGDEAQRAAVLADVVSASVGGMNAQLANTNEGKAKQVSNAIGDIKEKIGLLYSRIQPTVLAFNELSKTVYSFLMIGRGINQVIKYFKETGKAIKVLSVSVSGLGGASTGASVGVSALKTAIQGLMMATGVGVALTLLGVVISKLIGSFDQAKLSAKGAAGGIKDLGQAADAVQEAYDNTLSSTYSDLMSKYEKLKQEWKSLSTEQQKIAWIKNNKASFDDLRLGIDNVTDAESIFNGNTDSVVEAFSRRAKAAARMAQLTELYRKQIELADKYSDTKTAIQETAKRNGRQAQAGNLVPEGWRNERYGEVDREGKWRFTEEGAKLYSGTDVSSALSLRAIEKKMADNDELIKRVEKQFAEENATNGIIQPVVNNPDSNISDKLSTTKDELSLVENAKTYKDLANNVSYYQQELEKADITDKDNLLSLARKKAEAEKLVEEFKKLTDVSEKAAEYKPEDISKLSTIGDIDKAISFYTDEQKKADANRIQELQIMINDLTAKKNILQIGTELPDMQKQMEEISGLTGKELTMRITGLGFDELTAKVKELNALLSNTENPLTDEQREQVVRMRDQYAQWANSVQQTTDKMKALEGVSNVAGSVDTLANSLKGLAGESKEMAAAMAGVSLAATIAQMVAGMVKKANETTLTIWDWIAGIAAGTAAVISAASQLKGISAFANGGIVSGPTMALVGEYAGASNNPDVIAPLDKLRSMIKTPDDIGGRVTFHIEGRTLVGVLNKENNMRGRS